MKVRDIMTSPVIRISPEEPVEVAARKLTHYNIGVLPVCMPDGKLCGVVTDRDLVTRCMASGRKPEQMKVRDVMTGSVVAARADMEAEAAAKMMGVQQVRRLPVLEDGKVCGMVSLGDLSQTENTGDTLSKICANISSREK